MINYYGRPYLWPAFGAKIAHRGAGLDGGGVPGAAPIPIGPPPPPPLQPPLPPVPFAVPTIATFQPARGVAAPIPQAAQALTDDQGRPLGGLAPPPPPLPNQPATQRGQTDDQGRPLIPAPVPPRIPIPPVAQPQPRAPLPQAPPPPQVLQQQPVFLPFPVQRPPLADAPPPPIVLQQPPRADLTTTVTDKAKESLLRELGVALLLLSPAILTMAFLSLPKKAR